MASSSYFPWPEKLILVSATFFSWSGFSCTNVASWQLPLLHLTRIDHLIFINTCNLVGLLLLLEELFINLNTIFELNIWRLKNNNTNWEVAVESPDSLEARNVQSRESLEHTLKTQRLRPESYSNSCPSSVSRINFPSSLDHEIRGSLSNSAGSCGNAGASVGAPIEVIFRRYNRV